MKKRIAKKLAQCKRKIRKRLDKRSLPEKPGPMLNPGTIHYEMADRVRGITCGGIGAGDGVGDCGESGAAGGPAGAD